MHVQACLSKRHDCGKRKNWQNSPTQALSVRISTYHKHQAYREPDFKYIKLLQRLVDKLRVAHECSRYGMAPDVRDCKSTLLWITLWVIKWLRKTRRWCSTSNIRNICSGKEGMAGGFATGDLMCACDNGCEERGCWERARGELRVFPAHPHDISARVGREI